MAKTKDELIEWYTQKLQELSRDKEDREKTHIIADSILCELLIALGCTKVVEEYNTIGKWYS
jgi:hypothetical protein